LQRLDEAGQMLAVALLDLDAVFKRCQSLTLPEGFADPWRVPRAF